MTPVPARPAAGALELAAVEHGHSAAMLAQFDELTALRSGSIVAPFSRAHSTQRGFGLLPGGVVSYTEHISGSRVGGREDRRGKHGVLATVEYRLDSRATNPLVCSEVPQSAGH